MNEINKTAENTPPLSDRGVIDFLIIFARNKKMIVGLPIVLMLLALAGSFLIAPVYKASAKVLPPQQAQSGAAALLAQLGGAAGAAAGGAAGVKNPNDIYIGMLRSRTIADAMLKRFDLKKVYGLESTEKARKKLEENTNIVASKEGMILIEVEDEDRTKVADLANGYVEELVRLTKTLAVTDAAQRRLFFERQLESSKNNLAKAEMALKTALDTRGVISVDADSRAIVETISRLRAQISAKEIQLNAMHAFVTTDNQEYKRAMQELASSRAELRKLESGRGGAVGAETEAFATPGLENIKVLREVKYHQMLYELLSKQYEIARLDEAKDASIIQTLDRALEPERKIKPKRSLLMIGAGLFGLFFAFGFALFDEARRKLLQNQESAAKISELKSHLRFR